MRKIFLFASIQICIEFIYPYSYSYITFLSLELYPYIVKQSHTQRNISRVGLERIKCTLTPYPYLGPIPITNSHRPDFLIFYKSLASSIKKDKWGS